MDTARYRDLFISEAREHLTSLGSLSIRCEEGSADSDTINEMFRHAHSLKGMAATMQLLPISSLAHALEDLLVRIRDGQLVADRNVVDLILQAIDSLEQMLLVVAQEGTLPDMETLAASIRDFTPGAARPAAPAPSKQTAAAATPEVPAAPSSAESVTTKVKTALLDRLVNLSGELLTVRHTLEACAQRHQTGELTEPLKELSTLLRQLQQEVLQARMVPFATIAERYPRMVRDLAHKSGKEVSFQISGSSIELDRGILEQIIEPLLHLLRNAVDHGLETPAERAACGKPATGSLQLAISRLTDQVLLEVHDDGRGMDPARIRAKAMSQGLLTEQQAAGLSQQEILLLVCTPGFSTAAAVTEISGRGVGMDVVRSAIQQIGGSLTIDSNLGKGTTISLRLPLSVAIMHALMVTCGNLLLAVPVSAITGTCEIQRHQIIDAGNEQFLLHNGSKLPLRNLSRFFQQPATPPDKQLLPVLLTASNKQPIGLLVDTLLGQQEIFVRPLRHPLSDLRGISGSCLMGNGQLVFIVDPAACAGPVIAA